MHTQGWIQDSRSRERYPSRARQHTIFPKFSKKLHEIEKILSRRVEGAGRLLRFATDTNSCIRTLANKRGGVADMDLFFFYHMVFLEEMEKCRVDALLQLGINSMGNPGFITANG